MEKQNLKQKLAEKLKMREKLFNAKVQIDTELQRVEGQIILLEDMIKEETPKKDSTPVK